VIAADGEAIGPCAKLPISPRLAGNTGNPKNVAYPNLEHNHNQIAYERFQPDGPFAPLLPKCRVGLFGLRSPLPMRC
jgi:hypothetical protein